MKIDGSGNQQWDQTYGGGMGDVLTSILKTTDGDFLLGGYSRSPASGNKTAPSRDAFQGSASDYWLLKIGPSGSIQWDQSYGGNFYDNLTGVAVTSDGGYLLVGDSESAGESGN
ncbi:MAG TPA: T9SS C-terminal target domain-containing protein, partial [Verrucomicrobiae bacterium]|nr:T9SS C-terminal target domain-containing protein [Verrucomicrobiae bacterium]